MNQPPQVTVVTPSFRNSEWLKLCIASVADQGLAVEHIVQDAGSDDGTLDWLPRDPRVHAFVEKDQACTTPSTGDCAAPVEKSWPT